MTIENGMSAVGARNEINANALRQDYARNLFDIRCDGTDEGAKLQAYFDWCSGGGVGGKVAYIPRGDTGVIKTSVPLEISSHLVMEDGVVLKPTQAMDYVIGIGVNRGSGSFRVSNIDITNLTIDCDDLALDGLWLRKYAHVRVKRPTVRNGIRYPIRVGDPATAGAGGYEFLCDSVLIERTKGSIQANSCGIWVDTDASDNMILAGIVKDVQTGIVLKTGNNTVSDIHAWANPIYGWMVTCFDDYASQNRWMSNHADTAQTYGFRLRSTLPILVGDKCLNTGNAPSGGTDNVAIAFHFDQTAPSCVLAYNSIGATDTSHRFAKDWDFTSASGSQVRGNIALSTHVVLRSSIIDVVSDATGRSMQFFGDTLSFSHGGNVYISAPGSGGDIRIQARGGSASPKDIIQTEGTTGLLSFYYGLKLGSSGSLTNSPTVLSETGSPEGVVTAGVGSMFLRTNGGVGSTLYVKESGTGNTGWSAK